MKYKTNSAHSNKKSSRRKLALIAVAILFGVAGILAVLEKTNAINLFGDEAKPAATGDQTTSDVPSAQENFSDGEERADGNTIGENEGSASVDDLNGVGGEQTDTSRWTTSKTGEIVVHSPSHNATLSQGATLSGTSSLSKVSFRIIDNVSGVIAQGELNVVSGKFAGSIDFSTSASEGRLDVFGTRQDGSEYSNVEIPIKF